MEAPVAARRADWVAARDYGRKVLETLDGMAGLGPLSAQDEAAADTFRDVVEGYEREIIEIDALDVR